MDFKFARSRFVGFVNYPVFSSEIDFTNKVNNEWVPLLTSV